MIDRLQVELWLLRYDLRSWWRESVPAWIAARLPRRVVYHALVRAWVFSLSGRYGHQQSTEVRTFETARRWDDQDH